MYETQLKKVSFEQSKLEKELRLQQIIDSMESARKDPNKLTIEDLPLKMKIVKVCEDPRAFIRYKTKDVLKKQKNLMSDAKVEMPVKPAVEKSKIDIFSNKRIAQIEGKY